MRFCDNCDALLSLTTKSGNLLFQCPICVKEFESTPEDTELTTIDVKESSTEKYRNLIANAPYIQSIEKIKKQCPGCKNNIVSAVRDADYRKMLICICGKVFY